MAINYSSEPEDEIPESTEGEEVPKSRLTITDPEGELKAAAKMKERIRNDKAWIAGIEKKAENEGLSVDSVLNKENYYFIKNRPDVCFPALADSIPLKQSSKAERILKQKIHNDE